MSSTQVTNLDLSEPQEVLDTEEKSETSKEPSTLNAVDQEVLNDSSEEKQKIKDLESETIAEERKQLEVVEEQQKDADNVSAIKESNHEEKDKEISTTTVVNTNETEPILEENNDSTIKESNHEEKDKEISTTTFVNTNETEPILEENKDQSTLSEWSAVWDENVQAYYYWNTVTNETTWENPNNNNLTAQTINPEYDYYYSQYGYYPEAYYYGYDNSALAASSDMTTTAVTTTEPPTNPLDSLLDKIDKEVKSKLDRNSSKTKSSSTSSTSDFQHNDQQEQTSSSTDIDANYDQYQTTTNDSDYQSFLAEHGGNEGADYKFTARFNARTGKFQRDPTLNPEKFSADSKAIRQMSYFFDYDQFAESRGSAANKRLSSDASLGDSIRSPKKLNKKDIEMFKQKKKEKKDMKKKSWLLSDD